MKVRMLFGTIIDLAGVRTELGNGSEHDLPTSLAAELIEQGRAEALEPAPAKKAKA